MHQQFPALLLVAYVCLITLITVSASQECQALADHYLEKHHKEASPYTGNNLVYFLHVPRTAGRTFHTCFLKMGTAPAKRCPKAYDHLRINFTVPNCNLLSSHDDFSVVSMLPDDVAVLTHLRDPVDRVLSAYEFAIEVAARMLTRPPTYRKRGNKIATEDVWPWSYLIPWFLEDMRSRKSAVYSQPQPPSGNWIYVRHPDGDEYYYNSVLGISKWNLTEDDKTLLLPPLDGYNNTLVTPLAEFVKLPIAQELLHNGGAFQVLGITNYSHWNDARTMRRCVVEHENVRSVMLSIAEKRIGRFMHVGVTDRLSDSVTAAAAALGFDVDGTAYGGGEDEVSPRSNVESGNKAVAAEIPLHAKNVRQSRMSLQAAQKELFAATQAGDSQARVNELKARVNEARAALRESQDMLITARANLPTGGQDDIAGMQLTGDEKGAMADQNYKKLGRSLGVEYQQCARRAQDRSAARRETSLQNLAMPDGRTVQFSKEARKRIPPEVIDDIRAQNTMDTALHKLGTDLLLQHRQEAQQAGKLKDLQPVEYASSLPRRRRTEDFKIPKPIEGRDEL